MFHTYVTASSGKQVDIDRARYLMDDQLFREAERTIVKGMCPNGFNPFDIAIAERTRYTPQNKAAFVWGIYCQLHQDKYGVPFTPDIDPTWDQ